MANKNILSQTCVKINNTYFDIVEGSFKLKKGMEVRKVLRLLAKVEE